MFSVEARTPERSALSLHGVNHRYADNVVLRDLSLTVNAGEILCLLGASGSGKSTALRIIAGLEPLQSGEIRLGNNILAKPTIAPATEDRNIGLVFQDNVLFPHLTVAENIAFGLRDLDKQQQHAIVQRCLLSVDLQDYADRYPHTLSGGQQQRVALVRALAREPHVMLLDEPFASVDATLRRRLREQARGALKSSGCPTILVTHDAEEALEMGDNLAVIVEGSLLQYGTPEAVWRAPASRFVAELFGDTQAIAGQSVDGVVRTAFGAIEGVENVENDAQTVDVVIRPNCVRLSKSPETENTGQAKVRDIRFLGDRVLTLIESGGETLRSLTQEPPELDIGDAVCVSFDSGGVLLYNR
ncbi:MAG: ABC transporter ATP-binding protein [Pseudomonadota bacterium]